ncbi:MAG: DUF2141 domain-containing protein, partial [Bradyrhizobium sp.]|jgi:uncharacterized protein (DUF2141 family)|uniref:DUF2141 domain-containing protein n=1 Tax=unclassified Sphingomonas TaxID=196159 RepID=UPI0010F4B7A3|nr:MULTISPECIES: DUF2141 domain-containing protein [unclassified Sphingomonas]MCP4616051.1 DUF2141 domain-containing protein [Bradyrhizobium sp.]
MHFARIVIASALAWIAIALPPAANAQIGEDSDYCRTGRGPAIQVNVQGLKDRSGELWLELYPPNDTDYLRTDTDLVAEGKVFRRTRSRLPATGNVAICVRVPQPGTYAVLLRHNRVGRDKFSFWSDGAGIPANRALVRSKPTVEQAKVIAGAGITTVSVQMQYLHGFGFSPRSSK